MKPVNQKILAVAAGLIFILLGPFIGFFGQGLVAALGDKLVDRNLTSVWLVPLNDHSDYYFFFVLALCIATGISVTTFIWPSPARYPIRLTAYVLTLAIILPLATYNYAHADFLVNRSAQAIFNVILIFCGAVVTSELFLFRPSARDLFVLQILAVLLLSLTAVFIPATFSVIWLLNELGVISKKTADSLGLPAISTLSGVLSAMVAILKFRREIKIEDKSFNKAHKLD